MKIVQSFAQFDEGSIYSKNKNTYLNFYSFLLSYLTLNKYCGQVTMVCNEEAYNSFIKYIPYDEIIFMENKNDIDFWSIYKIDAMKLFSDDLIHVDSDVFIFDDLFREFIDGSYDILVQDILPHYQNPVDINFVHDNKEFLIDNNIFSNPDSYDGRFTSCGTFGIKNNVKSIYYTAFDKIYEATKKGELKNIDKSRLPTIILEELLLYLVAVNNKFKIFEILPHDIIVANGYSGNNVAANMKKYTHMWFDSRFKSNNIDLMKNKIKKEFSQNYYLVDKFEKEVLNEFKI